MNHRAVWVRDGRITVAACTVELSIVEQISRYLFACVLQDTRTMIFYQPNGRDHMPTLLAREYE